MESRARKSSMMQLNQTGSVTAGEALAHTPVRSIGEMCCRAGGDGRAIASRETCQQLCYPHAAPKISHAPTRLSITACV